MKYLLVVLAAAAAITVAFSLADPKLASASPRVCSYINSSSTVVAAIVNATPSECALFNRAFQGSRFGGRFGQIRCAYGSADTGVVVAFLAQQTIYGRLYCAAVAPLMARLGWVRIR